MKKHLAIGLAALAVMGAAATSAVATPVRNVVAYPHGDKVTITAVAYSPPSAGCGAFVAVSRPAATADVGRVMS